MPTRIVLRENHSESVTRNSDARIGSMMTQRQSSRVSSEMSGSPRHSIGASFRTPIRRYKEGDEDVRLGSTDIRASPRIAGYLAQFISSLVMLVSVLQFYKKGIQDSTEDFVEAFGTAVLKWKLLAAIGIASGGVGISLVVILAHFDTIIFPQFWKKFFKDGSKWERNLLIGTIIFWIGGIYICTSSLSVGFVQPNVYFTAWIAFASTLLNMQRWRVGAGKTIMEERLRASHRETNFNWFWTLIFTLITSLSVVDNFLARRNWGAEVFREGLYLYDVGEFSNHDWMMGIAMGFGSVGICLFALIGNHFIDKSFSIKCCGQCNVTLDWRQVEGVFVLALLGLYGWIIFTYTGVTGIFSTPSNAYFGVWGSFFNSLITFGTWLKENKNLRVFDEAEDEPQTVNVDLASPSSGSHD